MEKPTFDLLMEKFQFHNTSVHFHAELAKRVADIIRDEYQEEAKKSGYFTEEFFEETESTPLTAKTNNSGDQPETDIEADTSAEIKAANVNELKPH